jgi:hypothetical protein
VRRAALRRALVPVVAAAVVGCGRDDPSPPAHESAVPPRPSRPTAPARPRAPRIRPVSCPPASGANCVAATGRVLYIQSVDPDGDGDLHVLALGGRVTAPGLTVFDVSRALRPGRDPRPGDLVSGAGPVYRGSAGQRQIQVVRFRVGRRAR